MQQWTHAELHVLIDSDAFLKEKSDRTHALSKFSLEEREQGKLQMMEIYAKVIQCQQVEAAKEYAKKIFACLREGSIWSAVHDEYASRRLCHSPLGNDFMCFCDEGRIKWVKFSGRVVCEDETGITLETTDERTGESEAILKHKVGDYRKDKDGNIELRIGSFAEFLKYPKGCDLKKRP